MSKATEWYRKMSFDFSNQEVIGVLDISEGSMERWEWDEQEASRGVSLSNTLPEIQTLRE